MIESFFFCAREADAEGRRAAWVRCVAPAVFGTLNANRARSRGQAEIRINVYGSKRVLPITFPLLLPDYYPNLVLAKLSETSAIVASFVCANDSCFISRLW